MQEHGPNKLWIEWQPAHTRASNDDDDDMRDRRRGNDRADATANYGRSLHDSVDDLILRVQYLYNVAKQYAIWCGVAAALQYDGGFEGCDHDVSTGRKSRTRKCKPLRAQLPDEA